MQNQLHIQATAYKQQGAVLIISLMILIILTMLGISALDSTKLQTRMAVNTAERNRALQVAEVGVAKMSRTLQTDSKKLYDIISEPTDADGYGSEPITITEVKQGSKDNEIKAPLYYAARGAKCSVATDDGLQIPIYIESIGKSSEEQDASEIVLSAGLLFQIPEDSKVLIETSTCN